MTTETLESTVRSEWAAIRSQIERRFAVQWQDPELPGLEHRSAERLASWAEDHGFTVTRGAGGIPTGFVARKGRGGPVIGILAEYDALPGLDNDPVPYRTTTGRKPGHACGHNHIGPANSGAAFAAAAALAKLDLPGEIVLYGTPAEEILWGKLAQLDAGVFDGCDILLTSHGDYQNGSLSRPCQAVIHGEFVFRGEAAHSGMPGAQMALPAAEAALVAFEQIRQERFADTGMRHVYRSAGMMIGITPEEIRLWCSIRHVDYERADEAFEAMSATFRDAAGSRGVSCVEDFSIGCRGYLPNDTVGQVVFGALEMIGPPAWTEADVAWMRELSAAASPGKPFHLERENRFWTDGEDYYGQDDGELSWRIPLGRINWAYPTAVPIHHWAWTALSGHPASSPGPLMASEALALSAVRIAASPEIVEAAKAELERRSAGRLIRPYRTGPTRTMVSAPEQFWAPSHV